jgi:glycerol kinase
MEDRILQMNNRYVAAIDQGTTSTRCIIFNHQGEIISIAQKEHKQIYPRPGWVEHNPLEIIGNVNSVIEQALSDPKLDPNNIVAVGVTNQRETTIVWNKHSGEPYCNAIVWQDTRTKPICDNLAKEGGIDRFRSQTGLPLATYFSGPKIKWILDNIPNAREGLNAGEALFGNVDTWVIWWLTGGPYGGAHVTDVTNASRTMLMNLATLDWDDKLLSDLGVPISMMPRIVPSSDPNPWGVTRADGPFNAPVPVCGDLGDQQAALVGQTCFNSGEAKNTYGTGCFLLMNTGQELVHSMHGLLTTVGYRFANKPTVYALEGSVAIAGALVQWLRDNLGLISTAPEIEDLARTVNDNGGIYFVPAFSGLYAPHWRSDARGIIAGLTRYVNKGHFARSALEATAYQSREVLEAMEEDSGVKLKSLKVDGGMVQNNLLMQFQADILNVPVTKPRITETTALGAAYAAGLAVGFWDDLQNLIHNWQIDKSWYPSMDQDKRESLYSEWLKAVDRSLNWVAE